MLSIRLVRNTVLSILKTNIILQEEIQLINSVIKSALQGARAAVRKAGGERNVNNPSILPTLRKVAGFLPFLLPIFAGLSATGA